MLKIPLENIAAFATNRPESYLTALLAAGIIENGKLLIEADVCARIHAEHPPGLSIAVTPEISFPSLPELARNFLSATARWITAGLPVVDRAQFEQRVTVCKTCPEWLGDALIPRCRKCGCTALKPWLATEKCPLGKW